MVRRSSSAIDALLGGHPQGAHTSSMHDTRRHQCKAKLLQYMVHCAPFEGGGARTELMPCYAEQPDALVNQVLQNSSPSTASWADGFTMEREIQYWRRSDAMSGSTLWSLALRHQYTNQFCGQAGSAWEEEQRGDMQLMPGLKGQQCLG